MTDSLDMNCWCCKKEISKLSALGCGYCDDCYKFKTSETSEWISVKDRLPCSTDLKYGSTSVIIYIPDFKNSCGDSCGPFVGICPWIGCEFHYFKDKITHWMPLPEPPTEHST